MSTTDHIPEPYRSVHKESGNNRALLMRHTRVGCFYCGEVFNPAEITEWTDRESTAICPHCSVDSVIPNTDAKFLSTMHKHWFAMMPRED